MISTKKPEADYLFLNLRIGYLMFSFIQQMRHWIFQNVLSLLDVC